MKRNIFLPIAAASIAAATAGALRLAAPAGAASRTAASGTEHFQLMSTSPTSNTANVIASGVFTKAGIDHQGSKVQHAGVQQRHIQDRALPGTGTPKLNPKTCLLTLNLRGTIALSGGTGAYKGISGKGTYQFSELAILAKSGGKCTMKKPPTASQVIIKATASVKRYPPAASASGPHPVRTSRNCNRRRPSRRSPGEGACAPGIPPGASETAWYWRRRRHRDQAQA